MIEFCKICIMPNSRPRIVFNEDGICNACLHSLKKNSIDWDSRKKSFLMLVEEIKKKSSDSNLAYDCIVPWSGGKDSTSIALKLKFEFNLNPLYYNE